MKFSDWLAQEWARQIGPALSSMTGQPAEAAPAAREDSRPEADALEVVRRLRDWPDAVFRLAISRELWQSAGRAVLEAAGLPAAQENEIRDAFLEVLQQSLGQLAVSLGQRLGREVGWEEPPEASAPETPGPWVEVEVSTASGAAGRAWLAVGPAFLGDAAEGEPEQGERIPQEGPSTASRHPMLDLLMEVELPVSVTFGRTQLRLKDAIKLTSGSIVELNRSIVEPVEVIVNNCVIARGEVVVVEGNYGVRIQQIVSRQERLRTLF